MYFAAFKIANTGTKTDFAEVITLVRGGREKQNFDIDGQLSLFGGEG